MVFWCLFVLELDWEKVSQRQKEDQLLNYDWTLDQTQSLQRLIDLCMVELTHQQKLGSVWCGCLSIRSSRECSQESMRLYTMSGHVQRMRQVTAKAFLDLSIIDQT